MKTIYQKAKKFFTKEKNVLEEKSKKINNELSTLYAKSCKLTQEKLITDLSNFSCETSPFISIVCASRKKGNPHCGLPYFLDSLLESTDDISKVEVVIRLDDDDDLAFYHSIQKKFGNQVRMRFVIKKTIDGFRNLFALHSSAFEHTTPTSCIIYLVTDDATFRKKNWDVYFIGFARSNKDNIFFINTSHSQMLNYENQDTFFWHLWAIGPTSCLPALGRRLLNINKSIAVKHLGWTPYGNNMLCDSFNESLQFQYYKIAGRRPPLAMMPHTLMIDDEKEIAAHKEGGLHSDSPVIIECYRRIINNATQAVIKEMAAALYAEQGKEDAMSRDLLEHDFMPTQSGNDVAISIIAKTFKENAVPGFYDKFMQSLLQKTEQLSRVEIIFIMTDHVKYYKKLAKQYGDKVRIVLLHANPTKKNGLSLLDGEMLTRLAPNSKMLCLVNESVIVNKTNWDQEIFTISHNYSDQLFFINLHASCGINYEEKADYFWEMLRSAYPGFSQMISRRIIENIYQFALSRQANTNNDYRTDYLFIGAVQYYLWQITNIKRAQMCENVFITEGYYPGNPAKNASEAFHDFMQSNVQDFFNKVANHIASFATQHTSKSNCFI